MITNGYQPHPEKEFTPVPPKFTKPIVEQKKPNIFKRIKRWWKEDLDQDTRDWLKIVGLWTVDGAMIGSCITAGVMAKKANKAVKTGVYAGYYQGQLDAYKEMAQNPYAMMDAGMKRLEQQGIAKKF